MSRSTGNSPQTRSGMSAERIAPEAALEFPLAELQRFVGMLAGASRYGAD